MLKRYWFVLFPVNKFGPRNAGVTATSEKEAREILIAAFKKYQLEFFVRDLSYQTKVIENIDLKLLDQNFVIPNMGDVEREGVWFPFFNIIK